MRPRMDQLSDDARMLMVSFHAYCTDDKWYHLYPTPGAASQTASSPCQLPVAERSISKIGAQERDADEEGPVPRGKKRTNSTSAVSVVTSRRNIDKERVRSSLLASMNAFGTTGEVPVGTEHRDHTPVS